MGNPTEPNQLAIRASTLTFGDIRWNRDGAAPHLICQRKDLILRKTLCCFVYGDHKLHRALPNDQIPIISRRHPNSISASTIHSLPTAICLPSTRPPEVLQLSQSASQC